MLLYGRVVLLSLDGRRLFSQFFRNGQVIETFRGSGIHQKAVEDAIEKLDEGGWVSISPLSSGGTFDTEKTDHFQIHIYPEGKVNQPKPGIKGGLLRFKWGL